VPDKDSDDECAGELGWLESWLWRFVEETEDAGLGASEGGPEKDRDDGIGWEGGVVDDEYGRDGAGLPGGFGLSESCCDGWLYDCGCWDCDGRGKPFDGFVFAFDDGVGIWNLEDVLFVLLLFGRGGMGEDAFGEVLL
jgi:hypothetical protein